MHCHEAVLKNINLYIEEQAICSVHAVIAENLVKTSMVHKMWSVKMNGMIRRH